MKKIFLAVTRLKNWDKAIVIISSLIILAFLVLYVVDYFTNYLIIQEFLGFLIYTFFFLLVLSVVFNLSRIASSLEEIAKNTKKEEEL